MTIFIILIWVAFAIVGGILARYIANKVAERKGWTSATMPAVYYGWFLGIYIVAVQGMWLLLYYNFLV